MKNVVLALVVLASLGSRPGCGPYKPQRERDDDGEQKRLKVQEHCIKPAYECSLSCFRREASYSCAVCCNDNVQLCDNNEKYDFAPCELIDPAPDAGPNDAGITTTPGKAPPAASTSTK